MLRYMLKRNDRICTAVRLLNPFTNEERNIMALWDTGATTTTVTPEIADDLHLPVMGNAYVNVVGSEEPRLAELIFGKVVLEDDAALTSIFCKNHLPKGVDILIGMDLICKDTFTLYTDNDTLVFEFGSMELETH